MTVIAYGKPVAAARLICKATLAGRKLAPSTDSFQSGSARCVWKIPKTAHGKQIRGSVEVTTANGKTSRRFAGTVR